MQYDRNKYYILFDIYRCKFISRHKCEHFKLMINRIPILLNNLGKHFVPYKRSNMDYTLS